MNIIRVGEGGLVSKGAHDGNVFVGKKGCISSLNGLRSLSRFNGLEQAKPDPVNSEASTLFTYNAYPNCEAIPCDQFQVAFQAVELWIADRAVLPVENSLGGSIHRNYDLLLRHRLHIVGEVQLPVHHCLLALPGVRKEYLTRVMSHPQALAQCELTLTKLGLNVAREAVDDTAGATGFVAANNLRDRAAIASARAADLYGTQILADGVQDDSSIVTRFVKLGSRKPRPALFLGAQSPSLYLRRYNFEGLQAALGLIELRNSAENMGFAVVRVPTNPVYGSTSAIGIGGQSSGGLLSQIRSNNVHDLDKHTGNGN
ncbi:hypothetical protein RJ639_016655 [Escallonia herrerae]|uniref:Prephenate dehydratase domain-containing protein n=1 Tax=Escallonia herrerae TaxID=1293975 RepID=A0AA89AL63_9ASTE|nr:hypothetical protein RJ639_016655 [Escallonia herrerae]